MPAAYAQHAAFAGAAQHGAAAAKVVQNAAVKLSREIASLRFSVLFPVRSWVAERPWSIGSVQAMAFLAFYPIMLGLLYQSFHPADITDQLKSSAWALGLYFAAIWGMILHRNINPAKISPSVLVGTFIFTAIIGISLVPLLKPLPFVSLFYASKESQDVTFRWIGYVFGVGVVEETVKAVPLYFWFIVQKKPTTPREAAFAGVMSGLGFGVAEAIGYSILYVNESNAGNLTPGLFVLVQFIRMISLPLLHALWAGMFGYFIGLAALCPEKRAALVIVGLGLVAFIHGTYDTFSESWLALVLCLLTLLMFIMYMRYAEKISEELRI